MHDGSSAVISTTAYARIYEEQQPRLVAYARSLTRNSWVAEDLVAEAHFRVWRRLAEGHEIDNVSAYLTTTVRHLAIAAAKGARETPRDPQGGDDPVEPGRHGDDPADQVSSVDLLVRVLAQLPERWVKALWLAEAEGQPLAQIGPQLGTKEGATAVLLHRAREGMRQAFLGTQTGAPDDPACQVHVSRMPAYVRGTATERQSDRLLGHVDTCDDCRSRLAALMSANDRLPALVGPALLVFAVGGTAGRFLLTLTAAGASAGGHGSGLLHGIRQATTVGGTKTPVALAAGAVMAGAAALVLVLGPGHSPSVPSRRTPVADAPVGRVPVTGTPVAPEETPATTPVAVAVKDGEGSAEGAAAGGSGGTGGGVRTVVSQPSDGAPATPDPGGTAPGSGNEDGDGSGSTAPPVTAEPSPSEPSPSQPADPDPSPPAEPTPPAPSQDPTPPAGPTDPTPVDTPPADDPTPDPVTPPDDGCPPPHGNTADKANGKANDGNGNATGNRNRRVPKQR
ncbi:sigma-70 family RNA polymerase sigma factor [Streptomyces sasae]|uniref:sigma-70 family RNA polymerase sigma factor n=1 Tax=Streptomyces sasae TaxID=1266772 RepID=UPI00292FF5FD|nr:sigma-70 family RNA polymerase sigma factor [Streptomyces sasae]